MTSWKSLPAAAVLVAAAFTTPVGAHHSFAMFDQTKTVTIKGQVIQFQWTNPHAFIELDVPNDQGSADRWSIELNSPNNLTRQGWRRSSVAAGTAASITLNPLRNGKKGGLFKQIILPDGRVLSDVRASGDKPINVPTAN